MICFGMKIIYFYLAAKILKTDMIKICHMPRYFTTPTQQVFFALVQQIDQYRRKGKK